MALESRDEEAETGSRVIFFVNDRFVGNRKELTEDLNTLLLLLTSIFMFLYLQLTH